MQYLLARIRHRLDVFLGHQAARRVTHRAERALHTLRQGCGHLHLRLAVYLRHEADGGLAFMLVSRPASGASEEVREAMADATQEVVDAYNAAARGEQPDAVGKVPREMSVLETGPFHAIDVSVHSRYFPMPTLTLGGLRVAEADGQVLRADASPIPGLYAAGRTAVGVCSNVYMSGLSYADCIFSGRRVGRSVAARREPHDGAGRGPENASGLGETA